MWLEAGEDIDDLIPGSRLVEGERILMEVSRKFTQEKLRGLAFQSGFFWQASSPSQLHACCGGGCKAVYAGDIMLGSSARDIMMQMVLLTSAASRNLQIFSLPYLLP